MNNSIIVGFEMPFDMHIRKIRNAVFTMGQGIDEDIDFDGKDSVAIHVIVNSGNGYVGTGRMLTDGHIGRLAVLKEHRGKGFGAQAVTALVAEARRLGMKSVFLGAQMHAVGFYQKLGFSDYGAPFREAGIEHIHMERQMNEF